MDGLSRERRNATTIKRKLLTMLLVFAVVATYIPFDRAFAANENGKGHGKQVERTEGKDASKKTQIRQKDLLCGLRIGLLPHPDQRQAGL